jgi:hypothetical protein
MHACVGHTRQLNEKIGGPAASAVRENLFL